MGEEGQGRGGTGEENAEAEVSSSHLDELSDGINEVSAARMKNRTD